MVRATGVMAGSVRRLVRDARAQDGDWLGQGVRYVIVGAGVAVLYVLTTLVLADVADLPFQLALAIGFAVAVTAHFLAQRYFVWRHEAPFSLTVQRQAGRYLVITGVQYGLTALSTSVLPEALGMPVNVVYVVTAASLTVLTFVLLRTRVFHATEAGTVR